MQLIDLTGQRFGRLTVLKRVPNTSPIKWLCRCSCGTEKEVDGYYLRKGLTLSCGCYKYELACRYIDIAGQQFGRWTAIKKTPSNKWLCKCNCGTEREVDSINLRKGLTLSCGCYNSEVLRNRNALINRNKYEFNGDVCTVITKTGQRILIDAEDYDRVKDYYCGFPSGYASITVDSKHINLHRFIMNCPEGLIVDHINGNPLDNRKSNLRICTYLENSWNTRPSASNKSGFRGVLYDEKSSLWRACIGYKGKHIELGMYATKDEAIQVRKEAENKYYGEFSYFNSRLKE